MERRGSGLKKIVNETKGAGGNDGGNGGNLGGNDGGIADLPRTELIIDEIRKNSGITTKDLAEILGVSLRSVERELAEMKEQGKIVRVGSSRSGHWEVP